MLEKTEGTRENGQSKDTCFGHEEKQAKKNKTENEQHGPHTNTGAEILKH